MKRLKHLIEKIVEDSNIESAIKKSISGRLHRKSVVRFLEHKEENKKKIIEELSSGTWRHRPFGKRYLNKGSKKAEKKERIIYLTSFYDVVVCRAILNVLEPALDKFSYELSFANREGKGPLNCAKSLSWWINTHKKRQSKYCLKFDIKKYFESIDQDLLIEKLEKKICDKKLMEMLKYFIRLIPSGIPVGSPFSPVFGNFFLRDLDYFISGHKFSNRYHRYLDDGVILFSNKSKLRMLRIEISNFLEKELHLRMKENWQVFPIESRYIDFCGYQICKGKLRIRQHIIKNLFRKFRRFSNTSNPKCALSICSLFGYVKVVRAFSLYQKFFNRKTSSIINFIAHGSKKPFNWYKKKWKNNNTEKEIANIVNDIGLDDIELS